MKSILSMMVGALVLLTVSCSPYKYETVKGDPLNILYRQRPTVDNL